MILGGAGWVRFRLISVLNSNTRWPVWENLGAVFAQGFQGRPLGAPLSPYSGHRDVLQVLPESKHLRWDAESIFFIQNHPKFRIPGKILLGTSLFNHRPPITTNLTRRRDTSCSYLPSHVVSPHSSTLSPPWQLGAVNCAWECVSLNLESKEFCIRPFPFPTAQLWTLSTVTYAPFL